MTGINCQIAEIGDTVVVLTVEQPRGAVESAQADFQTTFRRLLDEGYAKFAIDISHALALDQALIGELVWGLHDGFEILVRARSGRHHGACRGHPTRHEA